MATLVLSTVGTLVGGPIGSMIGAVIGQAIDARLFAPKGRQGPRLEDLRVQTSSYGTAIPRLYGRMRVSGTVIWSTDLIEHRTRQSQGKGRGSVTTYSYSVSLAVALSSRPIIGIGRIWADGNLLRGNAGDFKSAAVLRVHPGGEDQPVDPLIASAEGIDACPAYRGIAYAVLENVDLAPFGNRIPSLTFEIVADEGALTLFDPVADVLGDVRAGPGNDAPMAGCALTGASRATAIDPLLPVVTIDGVLAGGWRTGHETGVPVRLGEPMDDGDARRGERRRAAATARPSRIAMAAYDPARDYQSGVQSARVAGGDGEEEALALPCALTPETVRGLVRRRTRDVAIRADTIVWPQGFAALAVPPGERVALPAAVRGLVVEERRIEGAAVRLTLRDAIDDDLPAAPANGGRALASPDAPIGASVAVLFDLPAFDAADRDAGRLVLAAGGAGTGWRGAAVDVRAQEGAPAQSLGTIGPAAVLGHVESVVGQGCAALFDRHGAIVVHLLHSAMQLRNADDAALLGGANLAAAGGEVLQFGDAEPLGDNRWRLTGLLRGRMGTEDAMPALGPGDGFVLLDDPALMRLPSTIGMAAIDVGARVEIEGVAELEPLTLIVRRAGRAMRPIAPAHLRASANAAGLSLHWVRRSRGGYGWADALDAPLDESQERYRVRVSALGVMLEREVESNAVTLSAADLAPFGAAAVLTICVSQLGAHGASPPAIIHHARG